MGGIGMARMEISAEQIEFGAQTGAPDALFELGMLYATGRDVAADLVVAHKWFNLAAARGNEDARSYRIRAGPRNVGRPSGRGAEARPRVAANPLRDRRQTDFVMAGLAPAMIVSAAGCKLRRRAGGVAAIRR